MRGWALIVTIGLVRDADKRRGRLEALIISEVISWIGNKLHDIQAYTETYRKKKCVML